MAIEWPKVKISEVCELIVDCVNKTAPKSEFPTEFKMLRTPNVKNGRVDTSNCFYVTEDTYLKWTRRATVNRNDVLLTREAPLGEAGIVKSEEKLFLGQRLMQYRADQTKLDPDFLVYSFLSPNLQHQFRMHEGSGSVVSHIRVGDCSKFELNLPPLTIQKSIAKILSELDQRIELNRKTNQTLEQMAQALFKSWFVDFDPVVDNALAAGNPIPDELGHRVEVRKKAHAIPDFQPLPEHIRNLFPNEFEQSGEPTVGIGGWVPAGWPVKKLSDLLCVRYGKDHKKLDEGEYPVYGSGGLMRRVDKFLHEGESVLIPRKGTLSNIMYVNEAFWSVDTMFFTIPKMPNVAKFSYFLLKRLNFDSMNVGSAVPSMTTKVLNSLQIVYPTEFILAKFDEILGTYFSKARFNQDNTKQLERIKDTLLPKLISGAISINKEV